MNFVAPNGREGSAAKSRRNAVAVPAREGPAPGLEVESVYHLQGCELTNRACQGTACFVARKSRRDPEAVGVPRVYCLGRCFEAPAIGLSDRRPRVGVHSREAVVLERLAWGGAPTLASYRASGVYRALEKALAESLAEVIEAIDHAGLRGRGGAAFPVGRKWWAAARPPAGVKYVVANADEGDAGASTDRFLIEEDPHALIEGLVLAAHATGASRVGFICVTSIRPRKSRWSARWRRAARRRNTRWSRSVSRRWRPNEPRSSIFTSPFHLRTAPIP